MLIILKLFCCYQTLTVTSTKIMITIVDLKMKKRFSDTEKKVLHKNKFIVTVVLINKSENFLMYK